MHYVFICIFMYVYVFMCHGMPVEIRGFMGLLPPVLRTPKPSLLLRALVLLFSVKAFGLQSHLPRLCLPLSTLPFPNESGFQIFSPTPPALENCSAFNHSWFEPWPESPGHLGSLLPQNFRHHAVNRLPRGDRAIVEAGNCFFYPQIFSLGIA